MITQRMRKMLMDDLEYLSEEVEAMEPQIASVVIERKLALPSNGMPISWRRSSTSSSSAATAASSSSSRGRFRLFNVKKLVKIVPVVAAVALSCFGLSLFGQAMTRSFTDINMNNKREAVSRSTIPTSSSSSSSAFVPVSTKKKQQDLVVAVRQNSEEVCDFQSFYEIHRLSLFDRLAMMKQSIFNA